MAKKLGRALGKAALIGGAALLASRMMGKKGEDKKEVKAESKEDRERDAREALIASTARKRETPTETGAGADSPRDRLADLEKATPTRTPTRTVPTRTAPRGDPSRVNEIPPPMTQSMEGATSSGLPREARGVRTAGSAGRDPSRYGKPVTLDELGFKKGGKVKKMASGGMTSSASKRADGICKKGKTKGRMV